MSSSTDRIEKQILLRAPRSRVWRALSDSKEFGTWFQCQVHGEFKPGAKLAGSAVSRITGGEKVLTFHIEKMEPEHYFSYLWHPESYVPEPGTTPDPMTLIEFTLEETKEGTLLSICESGFDSLPISRRARAFASHTEGWTIQAGRIDAYVTAK